MDGMGRSGRLEAESRRLTTIQVFIATRSAKFVILVEGVEGAKAPAVSTTVASFAEGLQVLT
jgi:hypothetical protein